MSPSLPFSGLLDALRAKGLPLGVREYVAFAELWTRMDGATTVELRGAAGALLGSSPEEVRLVVATFDEMYGELREVPPPPHPQPPPPLRRWLGQLRRSVLVRWTASVALVVLAALALWIWAELRAPLPPLPPSPLSAPRPADTRVPIDDLGQPAPLPAPRLPVPPTTFNRWAALATLGLTGVGALLLVQWPRVRAAEHRRRARAWRQAQASMPGPSIFELAPLEPPTWFDRRDLEEAATLLGRAFTTGFASARLDPTRTVRATIAGGGVPTFVYEASTATGTLVVLEDIAPEMAVWQSKVTALLDALRKQGVRIERWVFDGTPALVGRDALGERVTLDRVARRASASGVLVISSGGGLVVEAPSDALAWRAALCQWTRRSWLNPVVAPGAWRPVLHALPLNIWPLTGRGVFEAAADLAVDPEGRRQRSKDPGNTTGQVLVDDVERLKRLIAVAGHPSLDLVEVLRQRFIPDAPEDTVLEVLRDAEHGSPGQVRLKSDEVRRLVAAERRENPARERAVREYVLGLLAAQPAPHGSVAQLRWRLADAAQRAALAALGVGDAASPRDTLRELSASPIREEVHETARGLADIVPADALGPLGTRNGPATGPTRAAGAMAAEGRRRGWLFPRPLELALAAVAALAVAGGLRSAGAFTGDAVPHVENAYRLAFSDTTAGDAVAGVLTIARQPAAPADAPASVQLYRDGQPFGEGFDLAVGAVVERPIAVADTGHHYQVRAVLPRGNLAVSGNAWVPPPRQTLPVSVDALPWAEVRVLDDRTGRPASEGTYTTPAVLNLAVGSYTFEFTHPEFGTTSRQVTVAVGDVAEVRVVMPGFDAAATAQELVRPPSATRQ